MCYGVSLAWSELPTELIGRHGLGPRVHERGAGNREVWFLYRDRRPKLPIWRGGRLQVVRWGNGRGQSRYLPRTGWTWRQSIDDGRWRGQGAIPVEIPASFGLDRGRWFAIREGIRGLLVPDEHGMAVAFMICEPSTHYYRIMTGSDRMPALIGETI
jgi:hypothetical protein